MQFRFMMMDNKTLQKEDLPEGLQQYAPLPSLKLTDFGIVPDAELIEKLAYFKHGVKDQYLDEIMVTRYPEYWPIVTLRNMCIAFGVE